MPISQPQDYLFLVALYENGFRVLSVATSQSYAHSSSPSDRDLYSRHKLSQFPPDHLLSYVYLRVYLPIVHSESVAYELGCDGGGSFLRTDYGVLVRGE